VTFSPGLYLKLPSFPVIPLCDSVEYSNPPTTSSYRYPVETALSESLLHAAKPNIPAKHNEYVAIFFIKVLPVVKILPLAVQ
jgi:hypothetical protein